MPLPATVEDVMELVIQKQCATVVVLCTDEEMTDDVSFMHTMDEFLLILCTTVFCTMVSSLH